MKKIFLLFFAFVLSSSLFSQSTFRNRLSVGVEGGLQINDTDGGGGLSNESGRTVANGGIYLQYDISHVLKLSVGTYYDPRGFSTSFQSPYLAFSDTGYIGYRSFYFYDMTYKINYLTFPLNLTYLSGGNKFRILVEGGIYLSVSLYTHDKGYEGIYIDPEDLPHYGDSTLTAGYHVTHYDESANDFFNPVDFGFHFAFGVIYQFSDKWAFTFKPGFNYGISDIISAPDINMKWGRVLKINAGIVYRFHPYVKPKKEYILQ